MHAIIAMSNILLTSTVLPASSAPLLPLVVSLDTVIILIMHIKTEMNFSACLNG